MSGIAPRIQPANCKLWLPCQDINLPSAGQTPDRSGNNNYGVITNATQVDGLFGKAFRFDATNERITIQNESQFDFNYNSQFTFVSWFRIDTSVSSANRYLIAKMEPTTYKNWSVRVRNDGYGGYLYNVLGFCFYCNSPVGISEIYHSTNGLISGAVQTVNNKWYHVACVKSGLTYAASNLKLYVNGVNISTCWSYVYGSDAASIVHNSNVEIGSQTADPLATGIEVQHQGLWNTDLSAKEIAILYHSTKGAFLL